MKLLIRCLFLLMTAALPARLALAQSCPLSPLPPQGCTFDAIDVATSQPVAAFCVGRSVRFVQCAGRNIQPTLLRYGVLRGTNTTFFPTCDPGNPATYVYTPTRAEVGPVTVSELSNVTGNGTYYIRTFQVYDPAAPAFTVAPCPSGFALVTVTDATPYDSYSYTVQAGAGSTAAQAISRNVPLSVPLPPGAASITVTGRYNAAEVCATPTVLPIPAIAVPQTPLFSRLTLASAAPGGPATLAVGQLPTGYRYTVQLADASAPGGFQTVATVPAGSSSVALPSAAPGRYRIFRNDFCDTSPGFSPTIGTLSLSGTSAQNRNQLLLADAGSPGTTYAVARDGQPLPATAFTAIAGGLEDPNVQCGTTYTYVVTATQPGGGQAVSNPFPIRAQSAIAPAQPQLVASFNSNNVVLLTPVLGGGFPTGGTLSYRRRTGSLPTADFGTLTSARPARDSTAVTGLLAQPPCYTVRLVDVCQNTSAESLPACPALLTARPTNPDGSTTTLAWTNFTGPDPRQAASYVVQRLAPDGSVLSAVPVSNSPSPTTNAFNDLTPPPDRQVLRYRLQVGGAGLPPGTFSYSNQATVTRPVLLAMPTAFTPNGDGLNDVLEVKGKYLRNYTLTIVDRNGQEVFRSTQRSETWDGTIRGHLPVLGTYAWRFQQTNEDGQPFTATGAVTILK